MTRYSLPRINFCSASQSLGGKNISSSIGRTNTFALMQPKASLRFPPVMRLTSPRCHFHAMHRRLLGSITPKYMFRKLVTKSSTEEQPSARQRSCLKNSVLQPMTAQSLACRRKPRCTSADEVYHPPFHAGSDVRASIKVSVNKKSWV